MSERIATEMEFAFKRTWGPTVAYPSVCAYAPRETEFIQVAGPCSVESAKQIHQIADFLGKCGVGYLRGGVFRAGTYPGPIYGMVEESLVSEFSNAAHSNGMKTVVEIIDHAPSSMEIVSKYADAFQVGARQMQNYPLLRYLGTFQKTVFLKRNMGSTINEFLGAAEHLLLGGKCHVVLIERGSSTFHDHVRWDLSISMIPAVKARTKIPIIVDASHGTGRRDLVEPMTLAGISAGADGYLVEVHPDPAESLSDSDQAFPLEKFPILCEKIRRISGIVRKIDSSPAIKEHKILDTYTNHT